MINADKIILLNTAKIISDTAKELGVKEPYKSIAVMTGVVGSTDSAIRILGAGINETETAKAELENPLNDKPRDYTKIESAIHDMLTESTGTHFLDSGGSNGRNWQRNRQIKNFRNMPALSVETWKDGETTYSLNVFHFLTSFLEVDELSIELNKEFDLFAELPDNKDDGWYALMDKFADKLKEDGRIDSHNGDNTYNGENLLSQGLQWEFLNLEDGEYPDYVILQIHQGADIRGGYTKPRIFKVSEFDSMICAMSDIGASCKCKNSYYSSDDGGYHWYLNGSSSGTDKNELPKKWITKPNKKNSTSSDYHLFCTKCRHKPSFSASL